ncbi:unnamed protein product, partial [Closterium sp. NIES-54]
SLHEPWYSSNSDHQTPTLTTLHPSLPLRSVLTSLLLQRDLSSVDRSRTPWLIASLHEPWYHSNSDHQTDGQDMRKALEETLYAARVDMLITGHVHAYERTTRLYNGKEDPCGIMHITVGSGGKDLYPSFVSPKPAWSAFREAAFGVALFKIDGSAAGEAYWH